MMPVEDLIRQCAVRPLERMNACPDRLLGNRQWISLAELIDQDVNSPLGKRKVRLRGPGGPAVRRPGRLPVRSRGLAGQVPGGICCTSVSSF
jgi:hypothetical protein